MINLSRSSKGPERINLGELDRGTVVAEKSLSFVRAFGVVKRGRLQVIAQDGAPDRRCMILIRLSRKIPLRFGGMEQLISPLRFGCT